MRSVIKNSQRFHFLDFLRLVAALMIVAFHCNVPYSRLNWIAVDFFFVLSGFVLAPQILGSRKNFIIGRIKRFIPLTTLSIFASLIFNLAYKYSSYQNIRVANKYTSIIFAILLFQVFSSDSLKWNPPLWSLSTEILVNIFTSIFQPKKYSQIGTMIIFGYILLISGIMLIPQTFPYLNLGRGLIGFSMGLGIRKIYENRKFFVKYVLVLVIILSICCAFLVAREFGKYSLLLLPIIFSLAILASANLNPCSKSRYVQFSLQAGKFSFPIYVWHVPIQQVSLPITQHLVKNNTPSVKFSFAYFITTLILSLVAASISNEMTRMPLTKFL
jgi:peptidoglycan/LPS O-acetylase OafA/YrhL